MGCFHKHAYGLRRGTDYRSLITDDRSPRCREDGEPDGFLVGGGPVDTVAAVGGEKDGVAGSEDDGLFAVGEAQAGFAAEEEDPFVLVLVIPEILRRGVAMGDDALDADLSAAQFADLVEVFLGEVEGDVVKEVDEGDGIRG